MTEQELGCNWTKAKLTLQGTGPSGRPVMLGFDFKAIDKTFANLVLEAAVQLTIRQRQTAESKDLGQGRLA
jgi:hypothetical protein